ncbi:MAG TPA: hypothetical protein DDW42_09055 [Desulfobacteraceae bacterium]|nr:hypothetical protein [Desulfobacteraceae bacterium]
MSLSTFYKSRQGKTQALIKEKTATMKEKRETHNFINPMGEVRRPRPTDRSYGQTRPFLQPLAVAIVCVILVLLVLIMGLMDLRSLDKTLEGYLQNRALDIVRNIRNVAEYDFKRLIKTGNTGLYIDTATAFTDESFSLQELLINDILNLAQEIDSKWEAGHLNKKQLDSYEKEEGFRLIALLDEQGVVVSGSSPIPNELLDLAAPVIRGDEEIIINIFNKSGRNADMGFIALRRKSGKGFIILALDNEGFQYRSLKVSIQRAIGEIRQVSEIAYLFIMDQNGRILGRLGHFPETGKEELPLRNVFKENNIVCKKLILEGQNLLEIIVPIHIKGVPAEAARLGLGRENFDQILKKERYRVFLSMAFIVFIAFLSMWLLYKNQNRHLGRIREMERRIQKAERLSALGRLAAGVAHEIRNPLNAISLATQRLKRDNLHQLTAVIRDEIRRLNGIIEEFLGFSRSRKLKFRRNNLVDLLREIVFLIEEEAISEGVIIKTVWDDSLFLILMDVDRLKQAFLNIIKNAIESIPKMGSVTIYVELKAKEWVSVKISDTGIGLAREEMELIFNPDYTTKEKGLGLGLPIAHEIIRGHGGEINVQSRPGTGTTFEVLLPFENK